MSPSDPKQTYDRLMIAHNLGDELEETCIASRPA